jgi:peptide/nickel transport system ATP-binding protein
VSLLQVEGLTVTFGTEDGDLHAVRGVSFDVAPGETVGIVGESGSGKSVTTQAILQLAPGARVDGSARFDGLDLLSLPPRQMQGVRGSRIGMVFQDPLSSLHPQYKVGWQIAEAIRAHQPVSTSEARRRAIQLLEEVGIPVPDRRVDDYPHTFSGGMRQRAMLAMGLALRPALLIADEPTTALDVTVQAQLLELIARLQREHGTAVILITHDLGVVAEVADRVLTMYAGRIVERADREDVFSRPHHPYTRGLLACVPGSGTRGAELVPISGQPPSLLRPPPGCAFAPRCPDATAVCTTAIPPTVQVGPGHRSECVLPAEQVGRLQPLIRTDRVVSAVEAAPLVRAQGVVKHFPGPREGLLGRRRGVVYAVDGVDLEVRAGETLGIVGESGCGKSTLARLLTGLLPPTSGEIEVVGRDLLSLDRHELRALRRDVQMIFQDPYGSLNPQRRVGSIIADPLVIHGEERDRVRPRVQELMELVGLNPEHYNRFPAEFSGGQRQRIGIARALALRPKLIVCDEPVSALDVSIQAQVINLLQELQRDFQLTYVVIAHDLGLVEHLADTVAVMYLGKVVEFAPTEQLFAAPRHPYTRALLEAAPVADPDTARPVRTFVRGDVPSPLDPPSGCRFHPRCPIAQDDCRSSEPLLVPRLGDPSSRQAACHYPLADAVEVGP